MSRTLAALDAFKIFRAAVFGDGALPGKTKQLIAVVVTHVTHTRNRR